MPLEMPTTDAKFGKCGMPAIADPGRVCNKQAVGRVAVEVREYDDDYHYEYNREFRPYSGDEVMVDLCREHTDDMHRDFAAAEARVAEREAAQEVQAEKIRNLEDQLRTAKANYPGGWPS